MNARGYQRWQNDVMRSELFGTRLHICVIQAAKQRLVDGIGNALYGPACPEDWCSVTSRR